MERYLGILIVIIGLVVSLSRRKGASEKTKDARQADRPGGTAPAAPKPGQVVPKAQPKAAPAGQMGLKEFAEMLGELNVFGDNGDKGGASPSREGKASYEGNVSHEGVTSHEGVISHEGDPARAQRREPAKATAAARTKSPRAAAQAAAKPKPAAKQPAAAYLGGLNAEGMRRAVVTAELLGRPVALRRGRRAL